MAADPELVPGYRAGSPTIEIVGLTHAEGGIANETILVDLAPDHPGMVVRLPPLSAVYADYDLAPQAQVQNAVASSGVPAPAPALVVTDPGFIGSSFMVMPRKHGSIPGPAPVFDPWVMEAGEAAQRTVHNGLIDTLAAVHSVDWAAHDLGPVLTGPGLGDALDHWDGYVAWAGQGDPLPELTAGLDWCRAHRPADTEPVLLWGDVRLGNLIFGDALDVQAVLDWDLASIGPRGMDLGWYFGLDALMEELFGRRVPGFLTRHQALARYESRSGHPVADLDWHEVFAMTRALAINDRDARISGSTRRLQNPMRDILRARLGEG
jgi:aminoglycoside phosphotransferase (APT) family kinase protein